MRAVRNIAGGLRGAYRNGDLVWAEPNEVIEADDFSGEWFAEEKRHPLDHDGDGRPGGSPAGPNATRTRGRPRKQVP